MLVPSGTAPLYGIERVLEDADHQHPLVAGDDVLGAVAVVDVEVDDRHPLQAAHVERMPRRDGDVVEEAEAHRLRRGVAWWPGGRTAQKAFSTSPSITASVAATAAPAARIAADQVPGPAMVSGSSARGRPSASIRCSRSRELGDVAAAVRQVEVVQARPAAPRAARARRPGRSRAGGRRSRRAAPGTRGGRGPCRGRGNRGGCRRRLSLGCRIAPAGRTRPGRQHVFG